MSDISRFRAEYFILKYLREIGLYASVFQTRISSAFAGLADEAKAVEDEEYARLGNACLDPEHADPAYGAEQAYFKGVEFFLATDAIRQGVFNLMNAGLFHLLEQQAQFLVTHILSHPPIHPDITGLSQIKAFLTREFAIDVESFNCWPVLDELRLVANTVKHGDGWSGAELKTLNPSLFKDPNDPLPLMDGMLLRPLVGEGLRLTADHFNRYRLCVEQFWGELTAGLLPIFCPNPQKPNQD